MPPKYEQIFRCNEIRKSVTIRHKYFGKSGYQKNLFTWGNLDKNHFF